MFPRIWVMRRVRLRRSSRSAKVRRYPNDSRYWDSRAHPDLPEAHRLFIDRMYFPPAGSRSTAGGRSHLPQLSLEAKKARRALAWEAYYLRVIEGWSQHSIAVELGVSQSTVARWLLGVPRVKQP